MKQIFNIVKKIKNKIIGIVKKIYKVKFSNIIYIFIFNILLFLIFNIVRYIMPNLLNIHLNLKIDIDYFTFYSYILSLILPLLIMLMDKISKKDYIIVETYIKDTMMFSILIYFCSNLVIMIFFSNYYDKYYLMFTLLISIILYVL